MAEKSPLEKIYNELTALFTQLAKAKALNKEIPPETLEKVKVLEEQVKRLSTVTDEMLTEAGVDAKTLLKDKKHIAQLPKSQQRMLDRFKSLKNEFSETRLSILALEGKGGNSKEFFDMLGTGKDPKDKEATPKKKKRKGLKRKKKFRGMRGDDWMSI